MFVFAICTLLFAPTTPRANAVGYLESLGYEHVVVEGTSFTGRRDGGWCKGNVNVLGQVYLCSSDVLPLCDGFEAAACVDRALALQEEDLDQALAILQRGCANGDDHQCLGFAGQPLEIAKRQAPTFWMGCGRRNAQACMNVAVLLDRLGDRSSAYHFVDQACALGLGKACSLLDERAADRAAQRIAAR